MILRIVLLWLVCCSAWAGEILSVNVEQRDSRYIAEVDMRFYTDAATLRRMVTDYPNLTRLNDSILYSKVLSEQGPDSHTVEMKIKACVSVFCKQIHQVQDVQILGDGSIVANMRPDQSDFDYGFARWQFWDEPESVVMRFTSEIEPSFWVPPLIGPWLVQQALHNETIKTVTNLDRLLHEQTATQ